MYMRAFSERSPFEFENWAVIALGGVPNVVQVGDHGIDGRIYPVGTKPSDQNSMFAGDWFPIQVKQTDKTGRPDIQQFMGVMTNDDRQRGFFVSFDYSQEAHDEVTKFHKNTGRIIKLITVQEEVFHSLSRELHDEFGQILTAIGAMLSRAEKKGGLPPDSPFRTEVAEVREIAQSTIDKIRSLSQVLHPPVLDDGGLEKTIDWYVPTFQKQTGIAVRYEKTGTSPAVSDRVAINVYRVLQEALNNMAKHSGVQTAWVRVRYAPDRLELEVEDHGAGIPERNGATSGQGTGLVAMRERAELLHGRIEFVRPGDKGTLVRLEIPLGEDTAA